MSFFGTKAVCGPSPAAVVLRVGFEPQVLLRGTQPEIHGIAWVMSEAAQLGSCCVPLVRQPLGRMQLDVPCQVLVFSWAD